MKSDRRRGFSLLELLAVLAIMAMLAAVVVVSSRGPLRAAKLENAAGQLRLFDQQIRTHSRRSGQRQELTFDLNTGRLRASVIGDDAQPPREQTLGATIDRVILGRRVHDYGEVSIRFDSAGRTPTYAVRIAASEDVRRWLLVAGITGEVTEWEHEDEVRSIIDFLSQ